MAARFALVYEKDVGSFDFEAFWSMLAAQGLRLRHPGRDVILALDRMGDEVTMERDELEQRIERGEDITFELWYATDHDLVCRSRTVAGVRVIAFDMAGTDEHERAALRQSLEQYFRRPGNKDHRLGIVVDGEGITADHDWDAFFVYEETLMASDFPDGLPELILVTGEQWSRMHGFSVSERDGDTVRISSKAMK